MDAIATSDLAQPKRRFWGRVRNRIAYEAGRLSDRLQHSPVSRAVARAAGADAPRIPSPSLRPELRALYMLASECPAGATAVEIGSYRGASSVYIAAALQAKRGRLVCVDTWRNDTMPEGARDMLNEFKANTRYLENSISMLRKPSYELTQAEIPRPLWFAFIDGDHSYEAARGDYLIVRDAVPVGGVIAFHDFTRHFPGVTRAVGEALAEGKWTVGGCVHSLIWLRRASS